jgi:hypothetical protein
MTTSDVTERLLPGEKIVWSGRPTQGLLLTGQDWLLIPFSLLWGGFAVFWETSVLAQTQAPLMMKLWGIPFVLAGLFFIAGRFLLDAWVRRRTRYAVTNRRILIARSGIFGKFIALSLERLPDASLSQRTNGSGTIRFGQQASRWGSSFSGWIPSLDPTPQFIGVENAQSVFDQVQLAARSSA